MGIFGLLGANANQKLLEAAKSGDLVRIEQALKDGADVNFEARKRGTALSQAYASGKKQACLYLIRRGASLEGRLPRQILLSEIKSDPNFCAELLHEGLDPNCRDKFGASPLILASAYGKTQLALKLLEKGADVDLSDEDGTTALMAAAAVGNKAIVKALLFRGADTGAKNKEGMSASDLAEKRQQEEVLALLTASGE